MCRTISSTKLVIKLCKLFYYFLIKVWFTLDDPVIKTFENKKMFFSVIPIISLLHFCSFEDYLEVVNYSSTIFLSFMFYCHATHFYQDILQLFHVMCLKNLSFRCFLVVNGYQFSTMNITVFFVNFITAISLFKSIKCESDNSKNATLYSAKSNSTGDSSRFMPPPPPLAPPLLFPVIS